MESLRVALGERSYPIHIGAGLLDAADLYRPHLAGGSAAIVTSRSIAPLYIPRVRKALETAGAKVAEIVMEDGEQAKSWEQVDEICGALLRARFGRDALLVALGGGVIGDLAGFSAAVYQRGIDFLQIPTTLLAQVDSSVGGKTAINHALGKNMVGAFHQPLAVIADIATLDTLPDRELSAGLAEVVKYGLALDAPFVAWLEKNVEKLRGRERGALEYAVRRCCELKARVVEADEREAGERALLNLGHTFGHAIEGGVGYGQWLHGEAVSAGMVLAGELSRRLGLISAADVARMRKLLERAGLPIAGPKLRPEDMMDLMAVDKKAAQGKVRFVLLTSIGSATLRAGIDASLVREAIVSAMQ